MSLNPRLNNWHGKTVWIVGGSTGIGLSLAKSLVASGAKVINSARKAQALQDWADACNATLKTGTPPRAVALPLDVTNAQAVQAAAQTVLQQGPLDMVVYCAGYYQEMRATGFDLAEVLRHENINYVGALHVLDALLPALLKQAAVVPAHISLVSSVAGFRGLPKSLAYGPTKAALINLAETLYLDLQDLGVAVSVINPGFVDTPLTAPNEFHMPSLISADQAAQEILKGWAKGEFELHFPKKFTHVMKLLRLLPYRLYFPAIRKMTGL
jgi:NAD(P)-dependent dehydrogenase (short-subunit alcohol dehydrogenase family)